MLKVKDSYLKCIYSSDLPKNSIKLLLFMLIHADNNGEISINHTRISRQLHISNGSYYNSINLLVESGLIFKVGRFKDISIFHIEGSDFSDSNSLSAYTQINTPFFTDAIYLRHKASEIKTFIFSYFQVAKKKGLSVVREGIMTQENSKNKTFKKCAIKSLSDNTNLTRRTARNCLKFLMKANILSVGFGVVPNKSNTGYLDVVSLRQKYTYHTHVKIHEKGVLTDKVMQYDYAPNKYLISDICESINLDYDDQELNDSSVLIRQYFCSMHHQTIREILTGCLSRLKSHNNNLNSKVLHILIRKTVNKYKNSVVLS